MNATKGDWIRYVRRTDGRTYKGRVTEVNSRGNFTVEFDAIDRVKDGGLGVKHFTHHSVKPSDVIAVDTPEEGEAAQQSVYAWAAQIGAAPISQRGKDEK